MNIIKNGGSFKLNNSVSLNRELGELASLGEIDNLDVIIKVEGVKGWDSTKIVSRDYDGIINEVNEAVKKAYAKAAENLCREFKAGHC